MRRICAGLAVFFGVAAAPFAASAQTPLFTDHSEIQLIIEAPIQTIVREARRSTDEHPGALTLVGSGEPHRFEIELSARGLSRRTRNYCTFPPLRLNFGDGVRGTLFQGQNRIKLVTRCRSTGSYEALPVLEYLTYRLYNELTPFSYRVRPANVTYRDSGGRRSEETQFNFLIEDVDDLARRNGRVELDVMAGEIQSSQLNPQAATLYGLFQFMIGNLDWDMVTARAGEECCHNSRLLAASQAARADLIPAPYDFDFAGFVDAPYAVPPESIPIRNVRMRYYRGYCRFNDHLPAAMETFRARRSAIEAVIAGETRLSQSRRDAALRYIGSFFDVIDDPDEVDRQIIRRCRG